MERYRGYLIEHSSWQKEIKEWYGGHSSEGTGTYETRHSYNIVNPRNMKKISGDSIDNCKDIIDRMKDHKEAAAAASLAIKNLKKDLELARELLDSKIDTLETKFSLKQDKIYEKIKKLKRKTIPDWF